MASESYVVESIRRSKQGLKFMGDSVLQLERSDVQISIQLH